MTTTVNRILLGSTRDDAKLVIHWANEAAVRGGSFTVENKYDGNWFSVITINWPSEKVKEEVTKQDDPLGSAEWHQGLFSLVCSIDNLASARIDAFNDSYDSGWLDAMSKVKELIQKWRTSRIASLAPLRATSKK